MLTIALVLAGAASAGAQTTFTVNSTDDADDGTCDAAHCSLREAINAANATPAADTIAFGLTPGVVSTIATLSELPQITRPLTIDGYDTDDGACDVTHCSLREAIVASNFHPGADTIAFNIAPAGAVHTIDTTVYGGLPSIQDALPQADYVVTPSMAGITFAPPAHRRLHAARRHAEHERHGAYVITPTLTGYAFTPASAQASNLQDDVTADFAAASADTLQYVAEGATGSGCRTFLS